MAKRKMRSFLTGFLAVAIALAFAPAIPGDTADAAAKLAAPSTSYGKATSKNKIKLTWSKVKKAKKYTVYRNGKKVKTTKAASYTDSKAKKNKVYTYKVKTYKGKTSYSIKVKADKSKGNVKKIALSAKSLTLKEGDSKQLTAKLTPAKSLVSKKITWTSGKKSVAKVSSKGKVTAVKSGSTTVTARSINGIKVSAKVTVKTSSAAKDDIDSIVKNIDEDYAKEVSETLAYDEKYFDSDEGFRIDIAVRQYYNEYIINHVVRHDFKRKRRIYAVRHDC